MTRKRYVKLLMACGFPRNDCQEAAQAVRVTECSYTVIGECGGIDRLRELAEADKAGRLVVLPCKVGDTVWITGSVRRLYSEKVRTFFCGDPSYSRGMADNGVKMIRTTGCDIPIHEFGKTVFLTREEAEKALPDTIHSIENWLKEEMDE